MSGPICTFHNRRGGCRSGSSCRFQHIGTAGQPLDPAAASASGSTVSNVPPVPSGVCRQYWASATCSRGGSCRFRHETASGVTDRSESPTPSMASGNASRPTTPSPQRPVPPGVCSFFWKTGKCRNEFDCRYRHERPRALGQSSPSVRPSGTLPDAAMALVSGVGSDFANSAPLDLDPSEVQSRLVRFFREDYGFQSPAHMYTFLNLITCATTSNKSWTSEDGQLLLEKLAADDGIGLARLRDIFIFGEKSGQETTHAAGNLIARLSFQRGYMKLFAYYSSDFVLKSTLYHRVNALYAIIHHNLPVIAKAIQACMEAMIGRNTFADPLQPSNVDYSGMSIFNNIVITFLEYLTRYKEAVTEKPETAVIVRKIVGWARAWMERVLQNPPKFQDPITRMPQDVQTAHIRNLERRVEQLLQIVDREERRNAPSTIAPIPTHARVKQGLLAALMLAYVGPGEMRPDGPRHDNDHVEIAKIRIAPTHEELVCKLEPFLPANIPDAPHPFPAESMERLLDIQFRLLREELTAPLRTAVLNVLDDLDNRYTAQTRLGKILKNKGGRYRTDSVIFNVFTDIQFVDLSAGRRKLSAGLEFDAPPGGARATTAAARRKFWVESAGKRLGQGGLVALIWKTSSKTSIYLGLINGSPEDIAKSSRVHDSGVRATTRVAFFDANADERVLEELHTGGSTQDVKLMLEAPVLYEAIRPFLEALRAEPATMPFSRYLVHHVDSDMPPIQPPAYAAQPGFTFNLSGLIKSQEGHENAALKEMRLAATDPASVQLVRTRLQEDSVLDPSQGQALVDCLVREVAMCQGPPGTGKSFIGVQLLKVLLQSNVRPILLIAFTNHALDHLLESVLDAKITNKVARLGSKEKVTERLKEYSLETFELVQDQSRLDRVKKQEHWKLKNLQREVDAAVSKIAQREVDENDLHRHLSLTWPDHQLALDSPPAWVQFLFDAKIKEAQEWSTAGKKESALPSIFSFWLSGDDLDILMPKPIQTIVTRDVEVVDPTRPANRFAVLDQDTESTDSSDGDDLNSDSGGDKLDEDTFQKGWQYSPDRPDFITTASSSKQPRVGTSPEGESEHADVSVSDLDRFFEHFGCSVPLLPSSDRDLEILLADLPVDIWSFSLLERKKIFDFWNFEARELFHESNLQEFERLRQQLEEAHRRSDALRDQARQQILEAMDIIGCTTNGAAKLTTLMKAIGPKVVMVEEAGQVLEAHVLGSLVPSVQHLICIGDPLQLRPTLNNYSLSVDSRRGAELYKFDMSTMERLSLNKMPMSQLNVQRRMRPSIADLIRVPFLYPNLQDHTRVSNYPDVQGMLKNIFFMTHEHKEGGGGEESVSKHNTFEVEMIVDLASYLIRQTPQYAETGSIVVLCAYLGQLVRLRDAFSRLFTVVVDERDQALLDTHVDDSDTGQDSPQVERVQMNKRILLRTVDNYQGEEADIILLSLVRNSGELTEGTRTSIGFLKSINRTNVALSRARHGLYIFGNSANLALHSPLWASVIEKLLETDSIGPRLPIVCPRHQDIGTRYAGKPGDIPALAPDGGCLYQCLERLGCGHSCPYKCHPDSHAVVTCVRPCQRLCVRQHPCDRLCSDTCANCRFPMSHVPLPCGHVAKTVPCYKMGNLEDIFCEVLVKKNLPNCSHSVVIACSANPAHQKCQAACGMLNPECGHPCRSLCYECQVPGSPDGRRHVPHNCGRHLFCQHPCEAPCGDSKQHECTADCKHKCRQVCVHFSCKRDCGDPCEPCKELCTWRCLHQACPVPCGSPCARLPCDIPCKEYLACGHPCPSLCGEPCDIQLCPQCTSDDDDPIVDLILQRKLRDIDPSLETLDERIITLACHHAFTVETLDGHCELGQYYQQHSTTGSWSGLAIPTAGYKEPLACPTCRAPVTSPRYGRASKRADLDILERNVAGRMSRRIDALNKALSVLDLDAIREQVVDLVATHQKSGVKDVSIKDKAKSTIRSQQTELLSRPEDKLIRFDSSNALRVLRVNNGEKDSWSKLCGPLLRLYNDAASIVGTRFAHVAAYEAAFSTLYRAELQACLNEPGQRTHNPEQYALQVTRIKIGQPRPRADTRFVIEAIWRSIEIRLSLAEIARLWLQNVAGGHHTRRELWALFCSFIYASVLDDAERASRLASAAEAYRQVLRSHLFVMRAKFANFAFDVWIRQTKGTESSKRAALLDLAQKHRIEAKRDSDGALAAYRNTRRRSPEDEQWIQENFSSPSATLLNEWSTLETTVGSGVFYQLVTLEDKMSIVKALDFSHVGHFYCCPNGHTYIITECGGAMEAAHCPECDAPIGGRNHTLDDSNSRDDAMEQLARQTGSQASPWAWAA